MPADPTNTVAVDERLRVQERQLAMLFNNSRDMMMFAQVEPGVLFRVVSVNREYLSKVHSVGYRFTAEDFVGKTCDEVTALFGFNAAVAARIRARYQQVIETREVLSYDEGASGPAGVFHGRTTITPLLNEAGACAFVLYATQDVTAWKQAEQDRARSERMLRAILDHSFQFIGLLDPAGRLLRPNQTSLDAVGARLEDVVGRYFWETPWWSHSPAEQARLREAVARAAQGEFVRYETTHPTADGRTLSIDFSLSPVRDEQGAVVALIPEGRDITDSRRADQALRESEAKFVAAFRVTPDFVSITDFETGRYLEVNGAHEAFFGFKREEMIGRTPLELGMVQDGTARQEILRLLAQDGRVREFRVGAQTRAGRPVIISMSAELLEIDGRKCILRASRDITAAVQAEQALRESEEKFARAFLACPDAMSVHELESGRYVDVNEGFLRLFGYAREEIVGRTPIELGLWQESANREAFVQQLRQDGRVRNFRVKVRRRDGTGRVCELSAERIEIGGRPHNVTVLHDITDQLEAEQAARSSEDRFARAFRASPDAISISDLATGRLLEVNEGFERLSGYSRAELIGRSAAELGLWPTPAERERLTAELQRAGAVRNLQVRVQNRTGEQGEFLISAEVVDIGGQPCLIIVAHDVRERLRAEAALRESEEKFAKAFRSSPLPLIISELATGRYVDVNLGFERVTGYRREEVVGRTSAEIGVWDNPADRAELVRRLQGDGMVRDMELCFRHKNGGKLVTLCSFETIDLAGRPCMLSTIHDITEQRRTEEQNAVLEAQLRQNQKLESLGTLAGGIAHDFNNILTAIIVNQELALMDVDQPAEVRGRLAEIGLASNRAKELVRQILTFSRQQPHERLRQNLQMIVREALSLLRASLPATIEIGQELSPAAPPVLADAGQIHQVVMNLCTNAGHAMRGRPGRLGVRLIPCQLDEAACRALPGLRPGNHARLTISDTGHGMDAAVLARIFEPFFTTKAPGEGTGLGLPMVHGIVKDHDGAIFVQSLPGTGTTFDLYFPESRDAAELEPVHAPEIGRGRGEMVMIVDDEQPICGAVGDMLRRIGYRVETFSDPRMALERFRANPSQFNLLLTDRTMPHLSGPELATRAREWWPKLAVLLMSGLNSGEGSAAGSADSHPLLAKPVDLGELSRAVRRALDQAPSS